LYNLGKNENESNVLYNLGKNEKKWQLQLNGQAQIIKVGRVSGKTICFPFNAG
jgi:hypothetical protein